MTLNKEILAKVWGVNLRKLKVVERNQRILTSKGRLWACPTPDCPGELDGQLLHKGDFRLINLQTTC
jgi:hypothetical protein